MFPFFRRKHPPPAEWGLIELDAAKGIVYHAKGRIRNTRAFVHVVLIQPRSAVVLRGVGVNWVSFIADSIPKIVQAETRRDVRQALPEIFLADPNFIISITVQPNVGDRRELLIAPVRFDRYPYVSSELAKRVGRSLRFTLEGLGENITDKKFQSVSPLERLIIADSITAHFWIMAIARAYLEAVKPRG